MPTINIDGKEFEFEDARVSWNFVMTMGLKFPISAITLR
jgi:hypothetical protein